MKESEVLELIWGGAVVLRGVDEMTPLARLLDALLIVPTITLVSNGIHHSPIAMASSNELLPAAPLGDVLAEELGIHVPHDAIILIEPAAMADATEVSGSNLGRELGSILISMALGQLNTALRQSTSTAAPRPAIIERVAL